MAEPLTETVERMTPHGRRVHWQDCLSGLDHISSTPERMGGEPCVDGRRIPVAAVLSLLAEYAFSIAHLRESYPTLSEEGIREACEFAARLCRDWEPHD